MTVTKRPHAPSLFPKPREGKGRALERSSCVVPNQGIAAGIGTAATPGGRGGPQTSTAVRRRVHRQSAARIVAAAEA